MHVVVWMCKSVCRHVAETGAVTSAAVGSAGFLSSTELTVPSVESMVLGVKNTRSISLCHWGVEGTNGRPLLLKQSMKQRESQTHIDQAATNSMYGVMHPVI